MCIIFTAPIWNLTVDLCSRSAIGGSSEVRRVLFIWAVRGDGEPLSLARMGVVILSIWIPRPIALDY